MPDIRELGRLTKAKYPEYAALSDEEVGRRVKAKFPGAYDQFTDPPVNLPEGPGLLGNIAIGGQRFLRKVGDAAESAGEIVSSAVRGDFRPLKETAEIAGRAAAPIVGALGGRPELAGQAFLAGQIAQAAPIAAVEQARTTRRDAGPNADYWRRSRADIARLDAEAARDQSLLGKITRRTVSVGGEVATAMLSGGAAPLMAAGLELNSPENIPLALALGGIPGGARAVRGAAPAAERTLAAEATQGAGGLIRLGGAAADEASIRASIAAKLESSIEKSASVATSPWQDTTLAYFRSNLLVNPVGRAADLGSTLINQFADAAARPIAAAVDVVISKLTGARSITGPSARGTVRAFGSIGQGLRDAGKVLRTGKQAIESGVDDAVYSAEIASGLKAVDLPINGVFRVLGALDAPFRRFGYARNLYDRARVAALNEQRRGLIPDGKLAVDRLRQLLDDPDIIRAAVRDGEAAVLSESNKVSQWLASQAANSANARLAIGLVQPFMRIPLNAVLRAADYSGLGGVKAMYKIARGVGRKARGQSFFRDIEDQRVFSQNVAAGSFAPAAFILGMELEDRGKMEGYYYTSKKDYPNSKVPTSINIGGENYDINRLGGFLLAPILIGATYNRLRKQNATKANALLRSFGGLVQTAPALGYYGVLAKLGRYFTSDEPGDVILQELGSTASGFVPASGALGAAAKALDTEKRRETEGFTGPIMNRIPGLRQRLPVKQERRRK